MRAKSKTLARPTLSLVITFLEVSAPANHIMNRYREKRIRSVTELRKIIPTLDIDEGIRIDSANGESKCFAFVTKKGGRFTINTAESIYDTSLKAHVPGGRETWFYTSDLEEALSKIMAEAQRPLRAYLY